jgi:sugar diacid utilization regulator
MEAAPGSHKSTINETGAASTGHPAAGDTYLDRLYGLIALSATMFDSQSEDDVVGIAMAAVTTVGGCHAVAGYLADHDRLRRCPGTGQRDDSALDTGLAALDGHDAEIMVPAWPWAWALPFQRPAANLGYLVVGADRMPCEDDVFLIRMLAQQTAAAVENVRLRIVEGGLERRVRRLSAERAAAHVQLGEALVELEHERCGQERLLGAFGNEEGISGIARAVHELTGRATAVEDRYGNLLAWDGPGQPDRYPTPSPQGRARLIRQASESAAPVPRGETIVALARRHAEVLGAVALTDPEHTAGPFELVALQHGATLLGIELAHAREVASVESRLCRDLVCDLICGVEADSAYARADALGHDLHGPHQIASLRWRQGVTARALATAAQRAAVGLSLAVLIGRQHDTVVVLVRDTFRSEALHTAIARLVGTPDGAIGVGAPVTDPTELPRSYQEATQALDVRLASHNPAGITEFARLGLYRLLSAAGGASQVRDFVRQWLGPLIDYDARHNSDLMPTLSHYLDCGGNYDKSSEALLIHRSTLRYRLRRIREISHRDLTDVDDRLNLHVAVRAWHVLGDQPDADPAPT